MKKLSKMERLVLRDVLASEGGVYAYTFWRRYRISPSQIHQVLERYVKEGVISYDGKRMRISQKGRKWLIENRINIFPTDEKPWRQCPEEFIRPQHAPEKPFIPRFSKLDGSWRRKFGEIRDRVTKSRRRGRVQ